jgi:hypothetical protein
MGQQLAERPAGPVRSAGPAAAAVPAAADRRTVGELALPVRSVAPDTPVPSVEVLLRAADGSPWLVMSGPAGPVLLSRSTAARVHAAVVVDRSGQPAYVFAHVLEQTA